MSTTTVVTVRRATARAATAGSLAVLLAATGAAPALAGGGKGAEPSPASAEEERGRSAEAQAANEERAEQREAAAEAAQAEREDEQEEREEARDKAAERRAAGTSGAGRSSAVTRNAGKNNAAKSEAGKRSAATSSAEAADKGSGSAGGPASGATQDPPGNNGTIKIDGVPYDGSHGNEPHVTCEFAVRFWGFDAAQTADITITAHAPTGAGTPLKHEPGVRISDDAAGGGQDPDAVRYYRAAELPLAGITPHPKQGYHIRVDVDVLQAPGGSKTKVFWLAPCAPTTSTTTTTTTSVTPTTGAVELPTRGRSDVPAEPVRVTAGGGAGTEVLGVTGTYVGGSGQQVDEVRSAGGTAGTSAASLGRALPFTGSEALPLLALGSLTALATGTGLLVAARRRREVPVA